MNTDPAQTKEAVKHEATAEQRKRRHLGGRMPIHTRQPKAHCRRGSSGCGLKLPSPVRTTSYAHICAACRAGDSTCAVGSALEWSLQRGRHEGGEAGSALEQGSSSSGCLPASLEAKHHFPRPPGTPPLPPSEPLPCCPPLAWSWSWHWSKYARQACAKAAVPLPARSRYTPACVCARACVRVRVLGTGAVVGAQRDAPQPGPRSSAGSGGLCMALR